MLILVKREAGPSEPNLFAYLPFSKLEVARRTLVSYPPLVGMKCHCSLFPSHASPRRCIGHLELLWGTQCSLISSPEASLLAKLIKEQLHFVPNES